MGYGGRIRPSAGAWAATPPQAQANNAEQIDQDSCTILASHSPPLDEKAKAFPEGRLCDISSGLPAAQRRTAPPSRTHHGDTIEPLRRGAESIYLRSRRPGGQHVPRHIRPTNGRGQVSRVLHTISFARNRTPNQRRACARQG